MKYKAVKTYQMYRTRREAQPPTHQRSSGSDRGFARGTPNSIEPVFFYSTERQAYDGMAISDLITSPPALPWLFVTKIMGRLKSLSESLSGASHHDVSHGGGKLRKAAAEAAGAGFCRGC